MIVVVSSLLTRLFSLGNADGIMIFPFLFVRNTIYKNQQTFINHEKIHFKQALELGIIFFYVWYLLELVFKSIKYQSFNDGYYHISFEKEAYSNQANQVYLENRKSYSFVKYL
jgi:hypothetical protein